MRRILKLTAATAVALIATSAFAAAAVKEGTYNATTDEIGETVEIKVDKTNKGKFVKKVVVDQTSGPDMCEGDPTVLGKDVKIQEGEFKSVLKESGDKLMTVKGTFSADGDVGIVEGTIDQTICDGEPNTYNGTTLPL